MPVPDRATDEYLQGLATRLGAAKHGERGRLVEEAAGFLSMPKEGIYKRLKVIGLGSGRRRRRDRRIRSVTEKEARIVANLMHESSRANGKRLLAMKTALEIARANGLVTSRASAKTFSRVMRDGGFHPAPSRPRDTAYNAAQPTSKPRLGIRRFGVRALLPRPGRPRRHG